MALCTIQMILGFGRFIYYKFHQQSSQLIIESKHNFYRKIFATNGSVFAVTARKEIIINQVGKSVLFKLEINVVELRPYRSAKADLEPN